ncbi:M12 family metallopeptidase [Sphingobium fuliginis]|uniref:Peptidase n=1 Tax=Sphingobium fuliginis (strain ATCC 27551) TaxID=336203 RepID=A0ABQ1ET24_SPHSA|nr:M12 family metallopeptidase [Sphingobium fuliginis]GFZ86138.1 peptidase [Sphingobium fuliginis]
MRLAGLSLACAFIGLLCSGAADEPTSWEGELSENLVKGQPATALIPNGNGDVRTVHYVNVNGLAVSGGDMVLGRHEQLQVISRLSFMMLASKVEASALSPELQASVKKIDKSALSTQFDAQIKFFGFGIANRAWPTRTIPYRIDASITDAALKNAIGEGIARWNATGVVSFVNEAAASPSLRAKTHSLVFLDDVGSGFSCQARVGYAPAAADQNVWLNPGCQAGNIQHEIGHSLGLYHEHMRDDRTDYVTIAAAIPKSDPNFGIGVGTFYTSYDLCSIMHYPESSKLQLTAVGKAGLATCQKSLPDQKAECVNLGQRCQLSPSDLASVRARFKDTPQT